MNAGKWYFELEVVTAGEMRVGWARPGCLPDQELGSDDQAFVFDGFKVRKEKGLITLILEKESVITCAFSFVDALT